MSHTQLTGTRARFSCGRGQSIGIPRGRIVAIQQVHDLALMEHLREHVGDVHEVLRSRESATTARQAPTPHTRHTHHWRVVNRDLEDVLQNLLHLHHVCGRVGVPAATRARVGGERARARA